MAPIPVPAGGRAAGNAPKPAVVKTTVTGQGATHAAARAQAVQALGKEMTKGAPAARPAQKARPVTFSPWDSTQQLQQLAQSITGRQSQAQLIPLRQQAAQLANQEGTVSNRYAGYSQTDQGILSGLQAGQQASALTNENAQAQAAQATANQIDASGKAAAALNGGYTGPQAQAALANTQQYQGGVQGANAGYLAGQAGNNADLLTALRGTAALQAQEGQGNIASAYGKPIAALAAQRQAVIAKLPGATASEALTLGDTAFKDRILAKEFGLKQYTAATDRTRVQGAINIGETNAQTGQIRAKTGLVNAQTGVHNAATRRFLANNTAWVSKQTVKYHAGQLALGQEGVGVRQYLAETARQNDHANQQIRRTANELRAAGLSETKRAHLVTEHQRWVQLANSTAPGGAATSAQNLKGIRNIGGEAFVYQQGVKLKGWTPQQAQGAVTQNLKDGGSQAQAAIELATLGYVTPATVAALKSQGITLPKTMTQKPTKGALSDANNFLHGAVNTAIKGAGG